MRFQPEVGYDYRDVLIRPRKSTLASRAEVRLERTFTFVRGGAWTGFPLVAANMDTVGTISMAKALLVEDALVSLHKFYEPDVLISFFQSKLSRNCFYTLGISDEDVVKFDTVRQAVALPKISVDVANGYIRKFVECVKRIREKCPDAVMMAGTVVTGEMTEELISAGADIVRIGIGSGSVCKTRDVTGVGVPQLSAIADCASAAHKMSAYACADGGCRTSGDIAKALGAGADFVMLGGMLAGHDECEGEWTYEIRDGVSHRAKMSFYGMASDKAMLKRYGTIAPHRASEGTVVEIPYRGAVRETVRQIKAGLRSMMTYIGAESIDQVPERTTFVRVATPQG